MKLLKQAGALSAIAGALLASQAACAADQSFVNPEWANSAWYVGAGIGASRATIDEERIRRALVSNGSSVSSFDKDDQHTVAYKVFGGKQINRYLALEAGYFDLGRFGFNAVTSDGSLSGVAKMRGVNADLVAQIPLSERFSVLGRLGVQHITTKTSFGGNRLNAVTAPESSARKAGHKLGLGLEYKFSEAAALRAEVERYAVNDAVGNKGDVDMATVGLVYKLGLPAAAPVVYSAPPPAPAVMSEVAPAPAPAPAPVPTSEKVSFAAEALFDFDKALVKAEGKAALDDLLGKLQGMNTEVMVSVGHTDSVGSDQYNQKLSMRRAEAVKAYIVSKGVDAARVYTEGKGESQPLADNTTEAGRAKNRRVTVEVVGTRSTR
jgi:OOP family OmpA-OmpF porin